MTTPPQPLKLKEDCYKTGDKHLIKPMAHPPAPWNLQGSALQTLNLVSISQAQRFVPPELSIIPVLPGKTLGGVYVSNYGEGSTLFYSELIVVSALVKYADQWGAWISHIYVDNPDSVSGGNDIWGLPKQLAQFTWETQAGTHVSVYKDSIELCSLRCNSKFSGWNMSLNTPILSTLHSNIIAFNGQAFFKFHVAGGDLHIPNQSPLSELELSRSFATFCLNPLRLVANVPYQVVDNTARAD